MRRGFPLSALAHAVIGAALIVLLAPRPHVEPPPPDVVAQVELQITPPHQLDTPTPPPGSPDVAPPARNAVPQPPAPKPEPAPAPPAPPEPPPQPPNPTAPDTVPVPPPAPQPEKPVAPAAPLPQPASAAQTAAPAGAAPAPEVRLGDGMAGFAQIISPSPQVQAKPSAANSGPDYPIEAARRHEQGKVLLQLHVTADGSVEQVDILTSSGSPRLDKAAHDKLATWHFTPATKAGKPVASLVQEWINFEF